MASTQSARPHTVEQSSPPGTKALFAALYSELRRLAHWQLARHGAAANLSPTTLLHQAYIDIAERSGPSFPDRSHFMSYAARVMRGLIIDNARNRLAQKRGGQFEFTLLPADAAEDISDRELTLISNALDQLAKVDPSLAELVDFKFFCGFSFAEIASMRKVSERTIQRNWEKARLYLHCSIRPDLSL